MVLKYLWMEIVDLVIIDMMMLGLDGVEVI